jgi:hypothetical protein
MNTKLTKERQQALKVNEVQVLSSVEWDASVFNSEHIRLGRTLWTCQVSDENTWLYVSELIPTAMVWRKEPWQLLVFPTKKQARLMFTYMASRSTDEAAKKLVANATSSTTTT